MSGQRVLAITIRIVRQIRRDRRTLALIFLAPVVILSLLGYVYRGSSHTVALAVSAPADPFAEAMIDTLSSLSVQVERLPSDEALARVRSGDVAGALVVEPTGTAITLQLYLDGSQPGRVRQVIAIVNEAIMRAATERLPPGLALPQPQIAYVAGSLQFDELDTFAPVFIGFFAFFFVFLLTSVSFLRERLQGSIERLIVSPLGRAEIVLGYMLGFAFYALIQSIVMVLFTVYVLRIHTVGALWLIIVLTVILTIGAVNLGIFLSTFARTELQVVQFIPLVITLQGLLSGIIWPVETLPRPLQWIAHVLPLTWANDALRAVMLRGHGLSDLVPHVLVLVAFATLMLLLAMTTLRREVA
ncbi:ABC transporter permease [Thermomicrobium sp. 4228-Ro]|uniref:ABC transporter permease n=1 Tax=Thermomicrobium sp. 4228-Ro TaxID=2993937 RepID=UPI002248D2FA|nr:ABC transporter permease [Thermomicrobium sp. 4228-Ro]MCX2728339.1 ABC transporter permease [Thermomicrobium sp. 4228-Ro]